MIPAENIARVREAFEAQAHYCRQLGSSFTALLCHVVGERLDGETAIGARILGWEGKPDPMNDSVPLRLAGALHALVQRGGAPALGALYPPNELPAEEALWREVRNAFERHASEIEEWLALPPQTNEVARSAVLMAGLLVVAQQVNLPMALYELGASGGLNLMLDRYSYRLGGVEAGRRGAPLRLEPQWRGPPPPQADVTVIRRCGVDLLPQDVATSAGRERLRAYVWADQFERRARIEAAIAIAAGDPPRVDAEDAASWLEWNISLVPEPGVARVVFHSIAFQYFPIESQRRIAGHLARVGAAAQASAPLAWLRMEGVGEARGGVPLRLTLWPGGDERELALANAHGAWIEWL